MKRSLLKRTGGLTRKSQLRPRSARRELERKARKEVCARVKERDVVCQAENFGGVGCWGPLDVHEIIPRSKWAAGYLVVDNCILVCRGHHGAIHDNPARAVGAGLLKRAA